VPERVGTAGWDDQGGFKAQFGGPGLFAESRKAMPAAAYTAVVHMSAACGSGGWQAAEIIWAGKMVCQLLHIPPVSQGKLEA